MDPSASEFLPGPGGVQLHDLKPQLADMRSEVLAGLAASPRRIAPKYFYDARGSQLFDAITRLPEYYPTRTEVALLRTHRDAIRGALGAGCALLEYGSGSSEKIRLLLDALAPCAYLPMDISRDHLLQSAEQLSADYPWLPVHAICADYSRPLQLPWRPPGAEVGLAAFFPGSSIGNFERDAAARFLCGVHDTLGPGGRLLIGVDRRKSRARLERAYDDAAGVTAAFNRNVLVHINRVLQGNLDPDAFLHRAFYDEAAGRIEMHLEAARDQTFELAGTRFRIARGERIHTENSYKYAPEEFLQMATACGFGCEAHWTDREELFSLFVLVAGGARE